MGARARLCSCLALALAACTPEPGLVADEAPSGPSVRLEADVDGSTAALRVLGQGLGPVFGLSLHVHVDHELVRIEDFQAAPVLGEGAVLLARARDADIALGGTRPSREAGEVELEDGVLGSVVLGRVELSARAAGSSRVEVVDALARRVDGSFVPLAAAGGVLTLEAP